MSSKPNFQLLDALNIPHDEEHVSAEFDELGDLNEEDFKKNLPAMSQDKLCEIIVCFRYLGLMQRESVLAMEELAKRRADGEIFDFEKRIDELVADLPPINIDINKVLKSFRI